MSLCHPRHCWCSNPFFANSRKYLFSQPDVLTSQSCGSYEPYKVKYYHLGIIRRYSSTRIERHGWFITFERRNWARSFWSKKRIATSLLPFLQFALWWILVIPILHAIVTLCGHIMMLISTVACFLMEQHIHVFSRSYKGTKRKYNIVKPLRTTFILYQKWLTLHNYTIFHNYENDIYIYNTYFPDRRAYFWRV